jgi:hypothetical protein
MKTAEELIIELEENAKGYALTALIVGFESSTIFVMANDPSRLQRLSEAIGLGGEPVGFYRFNTGRIEMGPLQEYEQERWVHEYLDALRAKVVARLTRRTA